MCFYPLIISCFFDLFNIHHAPPGEIFLSEGLFLVQTSSISVVGKRSIKPFKGFEFYSFPLTTGAEGVNICVSRGYIMEAIDMNQMQKQKLTELRNSGLTYKGIAAEMNISESAVKSFFARKNKSVCAMCKIEITGKKRFCSDKCRMLWWRKHPHRTAKMTETVCVVCGKKFFSYPSKHRKYCSKKCYGQSCRKENHNDN